MVVDSTYYDVLQVKPTATELEIKKSYRKLAITTHPDKNPGDETAHVRFQAIGEAYQVLSDKDLRARYDKFGKDHAKPDQGFEDPSEFFGMIFGGEAFIDLIGELSLLKDMAKSMDISARQTAEQEAADAAREKEQEAEKAKEEQKAGNNTQSTQQAPSTSSFAASASEEKADAQPNTHHFNNIPANTTGKSNVSQESAKPDLPTEHSRPRLGQQALMDRSEEDARMDAAGLSAEEKELRKKEKKKGGLTKEQKEELLAYEEERRKTREERVSTLAAKLLSRISIWTETDKGPDVTKAFQEKTRLEVENLKMESFGLEILHAVGLTYISKAGNFIKSQKFLGIGGFFSRLKDKGTLAKDTWSTITTAIDAQMTMEEMARAEEKGGEDWTDERKAEMERRVTGKILAAAWKGSRFEIQSVLRDVCDKVLNDKNIKLEKRMERAHAMLLCGTIYQNAQRDSEEEGDYMAFEQLMADAMRKKEKEKKKETPPTATPPSDSASAAATAAAAAGSKEESIPFRPSGTAPSS